MAFAQDASKAVRFTLVWWVLSAVLYPLLIWAVGQLFFPYQANGSLIEVNGQVVGSELIGQPFTSDEYFWSRPSTTEYSVGEDAAPTGVSGASNLAPSNPDLITRVEETAETLRQAGIEPTYDLLYTSGSSLDPHITLEAAQAQIERVAAARNLSPEQLQELIDTSIDGRSLGILGEPGVNVLKLNLALDAFSPA
ncbi:K(+)-transporting ATPase subunit C [Leptolyngbya sp. AN02str]|uniref:K(+)-transporting ATPase subunit C n=1 Tax=Leptolyngbya sp. AN02str TaxID=3423363 RepID=UPI003D323A94